MGVTVAVTFGGTPAGTSFTDSQGRTWSAGGTADLSNATPMYAPTSGRIVASGDYFSTPGSAAFRLGAGDFTIHVWHRLTGTDAVILDCGLQNEFGWGIVYREGNRYELQRNGYNLAAVYGNPLGINPGDGSDRCFTLMRSGGQLYAWMNATRIFYFSQANTDNFSATPANVGMGVNLLSPATFPMPAGGRLGGFVLDVGTARYAVDADLPGVPSPYDFTAAAPLITADTNEAAVVGGTVTFTPSYGNAPTSYQWKKNGVDISGATSASYTTPALALTDDGSWYTVVATNATGSTTSDRMLAFILQDNAGLGREFRSWAHRRQRAGLATPLLADNTSVLDSWFGLTYEEEAPPVVGTPWTPAALGYDKAWFVADNASNTLVSGEISVLADKSGAGLNATPKLADANNRAARPNSLNGRPVFSNSLTNPKGALRAGTNNLLNARPGLTVISLTRKTASAGASGIIAHLDVGNGYNTKFLLMHGSGNEMRIGGRRVASDGYGDLGQTGSVPTGNWVLTGGTLDFPTGAAALYIDGNANATGTILSTGASSEAVNSLWLSLGHYSDNNTAAHIDPLQGDVAEILVVAAKLTTLERQKVEGYMAWAWGVQASLPIGHPYKSAAPLADALESGYLTANQTAGETTQDETISASGRVNASQAVPTATQTANLSGSAGATAAQSAGQTTQAATSSAQGRSNAAQTAGETTNVATFAGNRATSTQSAGQTTQTATGSGQARANATQSAGDTTQSSTSTAPESVTAGQSAGQTTTSASFSGNRATASQTAGESSTSASIRAGRVAAAQSAGQTTDAGTIGAKPRVLTTQTAGETTNVASFVGNKANSAQTAGQTTQIASGSARGTTTTAQTAGQTSQGSTSQAQANVNATSSGGATSTFTSIGTGINVGQTAGETTQAVTLSATSQVTAAQQVPVAASAGTVGARPRVTTDQLMGQTSQESTGSGTGNVNAGQSAGQTTNETYVTTGPITAGNVYANQTAGETTQSVSLTASARVNAAQAAGQVTQVATQSATGRVNASQTAGQTTETKTASGRPRVTSGQTAGQTTQSASATGGAKVNVSQSAGQTTCSTSSITTGNANGGHQAGQQTQAPVLQSIANVGAAQSAGQTSTYTYISSDPIAPANLYAAQSAGQTTTSAFLSAKPQANAGQTVQPPSHGATGSTTDRANASQSAGQSTTNTVVQNGAASVTAAQSAGETSLSATATATNRVVHQRQVGAAEQAAEFIAKANAFANQLAGETSAFTSSEPYVPGVNANGIGGETTTNAALRATARVNADQITDPEELVAFFLAGGNVYADQFAGQTFLTVLVHTVGENVALELNERYFRGQAEHRYLREAAEERIYAAAAEHRYVN